MTRDLFAVVVHTLVVRDGCVLLLRRAATGYGDGLLQPPGGHVCAGESPIDAALRECREEARIDIARADLSVLCVMPYASPGGQGVDFLMRCERFAGEPVVGEPHKADHIGWYPLGALPEQAVPFLATAVECWREGRWYHEFGYPAA